MMVLYCINCYGKKHALGIAHECDPRPRVKDVTEGETCNREHDSEKERERERGMKRTGKKEQEAFSHGGRFQYATCHEPAGAAAAAAAARSQAV